MNARRPDSLASMPAVSSPNGASSSAVTRRYSASLRANSPANHMNTPVTIGYSTAPPTRLPCGWLGSSTSFPCRYGKVCSGTPRPIQSCWTSE